jgi:general stress protein 26
MTREEERGYCLSVMKRSPACYLATVNDAGFPEIRAILNLKNAAAYPSLVEMLDGLDENFTAVLTTNTSSVKVDQIRKNPKTALYFCVPEKYEGVMLSGLMEIVEDSGLKARLWQSNWTMYYPNGVTDPDYAVLRLTPDRVKAWGSFHVLSFDPGDKT